MTTTPTPATTDTDTVRALIESARPPCEVRAHRCGRPDRVCDEPADWVDRYRCGCPTPDKLLTCEGHHNLLPILVRDQICIVCCHPPVLTGSERI